MMHCTVSRHVLAFYAREIDICDAVLAFDCGITISEMILRRFDIARLHSGAKSIYVGIGL